MEVDFLILADYADSATGKITIVGGGWDQLSVAQGFPYVRSVGVGLGLGVPWDETNRRHSVRVEILNEDTQQQIARMEGEVEAGRAPGVPAGIRQFIPIAFNVPLEFNGPGQFAVRVFVNDEQKRSIAFRVVAFGPPFPQQAL
jgi:hypothetical protein